MGPGFPLAGVLKRPRPFPFSRFTLEWRQNQVADEVGYTTPLSRRPGNGPTHIRKPTISPYWRQVPCVEPMYPMRKNPPLRSSSPPLSKLSSEEIHRRSRMSKSNREAIAVVLGLDSLRQPVLKPIKWRKDYAGNIVTFSENEAANYGNFTPSVLDKACDHE